MRIKELLEAKYSAKTIKIDVAEKVGALYLIPSPGSGEQLYDVDSLEDIFWEQGGEIDDPEDRFNHYLILNGGDSADLMSMKEGWGAIEVYDPDGFSYDGPAKDKPYFIFSESVFKQAITSKWISVR